MLLKLRVPHTIKQTCCKMIMLACGVLVYMLAYLPALEGNYSIIQEISGKTFRIQVQRSKLEMMRV